MDETYAYCGYKCEICPAFVKNQSGPEARQKISEGWQKYYGGHIEPEKIVCAGCPYEGPHIDTGCKVRPCAVSRGLATCADCVENNSCAILEKKLAAIEPIKQRHAGTMPDEDYRLFIAPYESRLFLAQLAQNKAGKRLGRKV